MIYRMENSSVLELELIYSNGCIRCRYITKNVSNKQKRLRALAMNYPCKHFNNVNMVQKLSAVKLAISSKLLTSYYMYI